MDRIRGPLYSGPIFPLEPHPRPSRPPQRLRGRIVGVRPGRSGEVGKTQIVTIKLAEPCADANRLLAAEVELLVYPA
ncbi:MAG: hypothetical protein KatS3mg131_3254 [Candidatus Tectimicrobiota bacterium]|nr:MAG: hypothetical protein KatS3mg131_3254 [Candidatus Tectomicrobia bacterium]